MKRWLPVVVALWTLMSMNSAGDKTQEVEATLAQSGTGNVVLYVSNQSFDRSPVDITVHIDGKRAGSADFASGAGHGWVKHTFELTPGKHTITAASKAGAARFEKEIEIKGKHWASIDYWFTKKDGQATLSFRIQETPMAMM
jgi:hypothetical protein